MARIEETVEIKCPADKVFAFVAEVKSWPKWQLSMLEAKQRSPGEVGVGTTFGGVNKVMGRRIGNTSIKLRTGSPDLGRPGDLNYRGSSAKIVSRQH